MTTFFLKFTDEASMQSSMTSAGLSRDGFIGPVFVGDARYDLDPIGDYYNEEGQKVDGFHMNLRGESLPQSLQGFEIHPSTPSRVFG